jgi:membrane fusion protein, macrolide-specific efflux system
MKRIHRALIILLVCGFAVASLLISGCNFLPEEEEVLAPPLMQPATIEYRTTPVARGDLLLQSRMTGVFAPEVQQALSFERQGGRLKDIHVRMGEAVEEGQLLMELESDPLESQIRLQEIEVEKAESQYPAAAGRRS